MACMNCRRGLHLSCRQPCECLHSAEPVGVDEAVTEPENPEQTEKRERRTKRDDALKDQQSTGRKRAARAYPLDYTADCEWQFVAKAGGGENPIQGCAEGLQQARHHGPDKNTLNNEQGNVHRICHTCHNRWHAANDPDYDPNKPLKH